MENCKWCGDPERTPHNLCILWAADLGLQPEGSCPLLEKVLERGLVQNGHRVSLNGAFVQYMYNRYGAQYPEECHAWEDTLIHFEVSAADNAAFIQSELADREVQARAGVYDAWLRWPNSDEAQTTSFFVPVVDGSDEALQVAEATYNAQHPTTKSQLAVTVDANTQQTLRFLWGFRMEEPYETVFRKLISQIPK